MSATAELERDSPLRDGSRHASPRIYALDPFADSLPEALAHAAGSGFSHALIPPPFEPGADADPWLPASLERAHPAFGGGPAEEAIESVAALCRARGLSLLFDVALDRLSGACADEAGAHGPFVRHETHGLDPRRPPQERDLARPVLDTEADAERLGAWWAGRLSRWHAAGAGGFRLLGLERVPGRLLPALLRAVRAGCDAVLFAWTPGLPWDVLRALPPGCVDLVASSSPWWDYRGEWVWQESELLRRVAPVVGSPAVPFEPAAAQDRSVHERALYFSALLGQGWLLPAGFERVEDGAAVAALNALRTAAAVDPLAGACVPLLGPGQPVTALLRADAPDPRGASRAALLLLNGDTARTHAVDPAAVLPGVSGPLGPFRAVAVDDAPGDAPRGAATRAPGAAPGEALGPEGGDVLEPGRPVSLEPGEARLYVAGRTAARQVPPLDRTEAMEAAAAARIAIEAPTPCVDGGRFPAKRTVGESVAVEADIVTDGHDKLAAALRWRAPGEVAWHEVPMQPLGNDRWTASFPLGALGVHEYQVQAWRDVFATYRDELSKKHAAGVPIALELREGRDHVAAAATRAAGGVGEALADVLGGLDAADPDRAREILLAETTAELMRRADARPHLVRLEQPVPVRAERAGAAFASWYEVFPRSLSDDPTRHGTFADVERHLPRIRAMGFDVLYFPPIHPIGRKNRKGRNNSLTARPGDPGSPYAIGAAEGGHEALHPELGTFEDFERLRAAALEHGLELAMDFAIQCSPDHPWLREHRDWFQWRPDGSIRYAENPPKKYEDIVNVDFYAPGAVPGLWLELCGAVLFWAGKGVRLFRVDNPHTKPLPFWEWMIREVQARYPDTVFLSEAFTRPKVMYRLAKVGFSQSYTYFTWRHTRREFEEYLTELTTTAPKDFFRPHFFVNTPDINPVFLQTSGRPGFLIRAALAATLAGLWGVYNGFELCEGRAVPGKEEYLDSEKYEVRAWDWDRPGNIVAEVTRLNAIRKLNPALHSHHGVTFLPSDSDGVLLFEKATPDRSNVLLVAVGLDPNREQGVTFEVPYWRFGVPEGTAFEADDLVGGARERWPGRSHHLRLTLDRPYAIHRIRPAA